MQPQSAVVESLCLWKVSDAACAECSLVWGGAEFTAQNFRHGAFEYAFLHQRSPTRASHKTKPTVFKQTPDPAGIFAKLPLFTKLFTPFCGYHLNFFCDC